MAPMKGDKTEVTALLERWMNGDAEARDRAFVEMFTQLRTQARIVMSGEAPGTLQPTELVQEIYLKLVGRDTVSWKNRKHFLRTLMKMMRRLVIDHARSRRAIKRGGEEEHVTFEEDLLSKNVPTQPSEAVRALMEVLEELREIDPIKAEVVELKYLLGFTEKEVAEALEITPRVVGLKWKAARGWLRTKLDATVMS